MKIKNILVSQPKPETEKSPYFDIEEKYNVKIDFRPFFKIESVSVKDFRNQRVDILEHTAVIFNSRHGVNHFFGLCEEMRISVPESMKYFCVSEAVANYLQKYIQYRKRKIFFSPTSKFADLMPFFEKHSTEKYLNVTSDVRNEEVMTILENIEIECNHAVMYQSVSNEISPKELKEYDMMIFFSPVGVKSLFENDPKFKQGDIQIGCFGTSTAAAIKENGLRVDLEAPSKDFPSMTMALDHFLKDMKKANGK